MKEAIKNFKPMKDAFINGVQTIQEIPKLKCNGFKVRHGRYKEKIVLYRFQYGKEIVETTTTYQNKELKSTNKDCI